MIIVLLVIVLIPSLISIAIQTSYIQTRISSYLVNQLSESLGTDVRIGKVDIAFFNKVVLEKLYIEDHRRDTLIYIDELKAGITRFSRKEKRIIFGTISIDQLEFYLYQGKDTLNLDVFIDGIATGDSTQESSEWQIDFSRVNVDNSKFRYKKSDFTPQEYGMNYSDIEANNLKFKLSDIEIKDSLILNITGLGCVEKSGLKIIQMDTRLSLSGKHGNFDRLRIQLEHSDLKAEMLAFRFDSIQVLQNFTSRVRIEAGFYNSDLSFTDLSYFAPELKGIDKTIKFSGEFKGPISDIRAKGLSLKYGEDTRLQANMSMIGLPDINNTFLYADIREFSTSRNDIESVQITGNNELSFDLPDQFEEVGTIKYKGNLTGFTNDFVAYGTLSSNLGIISTDLGLKHHEKHYSFNGAVKTIDFKLGRFAGPSSLIGNIDLEIKVKGTIDSLNVVRAEPVGIIQKVEFNNYIYRDISINGFLDGKKFNGFVYISDPNIELDFNGGIDFSDDVPEFDFNAVVANARLDKLNLFEKDSLPKLSFTMQSRFVGDNFDNFIGEIRLIDVAYANSEKSIIVDDIYLTANQDDSVNTLQFQSSVADVFIEGQYSFLNLKESLLAYFYHFYPSFDSERNLDHHEDSLLFSIRVKDIAPVFEIFAPEYSIGESSQLDGSFNSGTKFFAMTGKLSDVIINSFKIGNIDISTKTESESLMLFLSGNSVLRTDKLFLQSIDFSSKIMTDSLFANVNWYLDDSLTYEGSLSTALNLDPGDNSGKPLYNIELYPSVITVADSIWTLSRTQISIDSSSMVVNDFSICRENQMFKIAGAASKSPQDTLFMQMNNIPLSNLNILTGEKGFVLDGFVNGSAALFDVYNNFIFYSDIEVSNFEVNQKKLGNAFINSKWDNNSDRLQITSFTQRNKIRPFYIDGNYMPDNGLLNFNIVFDRFYLSLFEPYLQENISELGGIVSDKLRLSGTIDKPVVEGSLKVQKAGFVLDYLNTRYNFSDRVEFKKNLISIDNIEVFDTKGQKAFVTGKLQHNYFSEFTIDVDIDAQSFNLLNTRESDNSLYYGKAYGTGSIAIDGNFDLIDINMKMKTGKGTRFFIPLSSGSEISESSFITFVNTSETEYDEPAEEYIDLSGVSLNMDLEVTPDAEVQLIFASKMGDIIKGRGASNLKLEISANGEFLIYGDYLIEEGEYLLTLGNLLSKRFLVKPGGVISWNGDPYNADIDLETYYEVNAALQDLYLDSSEVYRKRVPVECQIHIGNELMNPDIEFAIDLPKSSETDRAQLRSLPDNELNKQFISLLFINRFQPLPGLDFGNVSQMSTGYSISESTSELLSNQLSHWLSQISNDFDIGFTYRPGDEVSSDEVEFALKTQFFNQRLTVNGNVGMGGQYENTNSMVGDVEADLKLNESGKLRVKAFRRSNTNFDYEKGPTTQGVGVFYREEFDTLNELIKKLLKIDQSIEKQ